MFRGPARHWANVCFLLALFSKEIAVTTLPLVFYIEWFKSKKFPKINGIENIREESFQIYPNPANNKITISGIGKIAEETTIRICNMTGEQLLFGSYLIQDRIEMDVSMLTKGVYLVKIQTRAGIEVHKLVIQ